MVLTRCRTDSVLQACVPKQGLKEIRNKTGVKVRLAFERLSNTGLPWLATERNMRESECLQSYPNCY